jgi:hypothetical protein
MGFRCGFRTVVMTDTVIRTAFEQAGVIHDRKSTESGFIIRSCRRD